MTKEELMIGDWVRVDDTDRYHGCYGVISAINSITDCCILDIKTGEYVFTEYDGVYIDSIKPIPLTPEILEKNGWQRDIDKEWKYNNSHILPRYCYQWQKQYVKIEMGEGLEGFTTDLIIGRRFYAVHELQHALRLCGLNDLVDFKI